MRGSTQRSKFKKAGKRNKTKQREKENDQKGQKERQQRKDRNETKKKPTKARPHKPHHRPPTKENKTRKQKEKASPSWTSSHFLKQSLRANSKQTQKNASNLLFCPREFKRLLGYLQDQCLARWPHMALKVYALGNLTHQPSGRSAHGSLNLTRLISCRKSPSY